MIVILTDYAQNFMGPDINYTKYDISDMCILCHYCNSLGDILS